MDGVRKPMKLDPDELDPDELVVEELASGELEDAVGGNINGEIGLSHLQCNCTD